ncbi:hypothetical protein N752_14065 [Desulforamulus aquiferis]|nr:hypothetical protein N752_14065 [Desulforamulus aquiferis]
MAVVTGKIVFSVLGLLLGAVYWYFYNQSIESWASIFINLVILAAGILVGYSLRDRKRDRICNPNINNQASTQTISEPLLKSLPVALLSVNMEGQITNINKLAGIICDINSSTYNIFELKSTAGSPVGQLIKTLSLKQVHRCEVNYYQHNDKRYLFRTENIIEGGQAVGAVMIAWESTEGVLVEKYLSQKDKMAMIGELAAGIAHEIRNPLTSVRGLVQIMVQKCKINDPAREHAEIILSEIDSINNIIKELLLLARRSSPNLSFASLPAVLDHVLLLLEGEASCRGIEITRDYQDNLPLVVLDEDQIRQVFLHLATNAINAMPTGGKLTISVKYNETMGVVQTVFQDEGIGISEENISRIFHPFFTTRAEGTGLGLPVSCQIVDNHGGTLSVQSIYGKGSAFTVQLPLVNYNNTKAS